MANLRGALAGGLALVATIVVVMVCLTDDSVVRLTTDPEEWVPSGQADVNDAMGVTHADEVRKEEQTGFFTGLESKDFKLEDSSFENDDLELELLQSDKTVGHGIHATIDFGDQLGAKGILPKEMGGPAGLEKNCVTLRAYALALSDNFNENKLLGAKASLAEAGGEMSLNVLQPLLKGMGEKPKKGETCSQQYAKVMKPLLTNKKIMIRNSIAEGMLKSIDAEMKSKRGILVFQKVNQVVAWKYHGESALAVKKKNRARTSGQFVYVDANRVGWSGAPSIFARLAVRVTTFLRALHVSGGEDHEVVQNKARLVAQIKERKIPDADMRRLRGACSSKDEKLKKKCWHLEKKACFAASISSGCRWLGAWDGGEIVAEAEFVEKPKL